MPEKSKSIKELSIVKVLDASVERVWEAWTTPELFAKWWAPKGFTVPECRMDVRKGGKFYAAMHGPKGTPFDIDMPVTGMFKEVSAPKKLVFLNSPVDGQGKKLFEVLETVELEETGGKTKMRLNARVMAVFVPEEQAAQFLNGMDQGFNESIENLVDVLKGRK